MLIENVFANCQIGCCLRVTARREILFVNSCSLRFGKREEAETIRRGINAVWISVGGNLRVRCEIRAKGSGLRLKRAIWPVNRESSL